MGVRLQNIKIEHYRSIESVELVFPEKKPLVLFGPNNAGKSNILSAIHRLLGERYPTYVDMLDSDYFQRDKEQYPVASITATFNEAFFVDTYAKEYSQIAVSYGKNQTDNLLHDGRGKKLFLSSEARSKYQSYLIDAERNIQSAFTYSSRYSLLSKFSHKIHEALNSESRSKLSLAFLQIKNSFERTAEFSNFFDAFYSNFRSSVKGFVHSLDIDFSAYDPNNYTKSLRIYAKEGEDIRGFEEFGTGEQQVLLMAFVKAYMQTFNSERFLLIIEEPEAHLHPLAQKWLKEYLMKMCADEIQIIISTHSAYFIDAEYIDGLVRVYKANDITHAVQLSSEELYEYCIQCGVPAEKTSPRNIVDFYSTKLFHEQLEGVFAETIILVEGHTEFFSLPIYLNRIGFSLAEHGIEIINCYGKNTIPLFWRLFQAYGYNCYPIFDCDSNPADNDKTFNGLINNHDWITLENKFFAGDSYAYFGKNFEHYFRSAIENYDVLKNKITRDFQITSKPGLAKAIAQHCEKIPEFIIELKKRLEMIELNSQS